MGGRLLMAFLLFTVSYNVYGKENEKVSGSIRVSIVNVVNGEPLILNAARYTNAANDSFSVTMFKYYISNLGFTGDNDKEHKERDSYHLINEAKPATKAFVINIPEGKYKQLSFIIGVDSLHNVSGAQDGALDPINAMFWDWNTGYIMLKMEGLLPNNTEVAFHLGGYKGAHKVLRKVNIVFPQPIEVVKGKTSEIVLQADLAELFKTPHTISFIKNPVITTDGADAAMMADNYTDMFSLDHISQ
jgi:hypothetical protein